MDCKELVTALMTDAGMEDAPVFEDGACHLEIDGRDIGFMETDDGRRMVVWTAVGECPVDRKNAFLILLLRANFMGRMFADGAFSLSDDDIVYAHCMIALPVLEKEVFYEALRKLLEAVEQWGRLAETYRQTIGPEEESGLSLADQGLRV